MTTVVAMLSTPISASYCGLLYDKIFSCIDGDTGRSTAVSMCQNGFTKMIKETLDLSTQIALAYDGIVVGINIFNVINSGGTFELTLLTSLIEYANVVTLPTYGGFVCAYFYLNSSGNDSNLVAGDTTECENVDRTDFTTTFGLWIAEFESIVAKVEAETITMVDAFPCFLGEDLINSLLTGFLPFDLTILDF